MYFHVINLVVEVFYMSTWKSCDFPAQTAQFQILWRFKHIVTLASEPAKFFRDPWVSWCLFDTYSCQDGRLNKLGHTFAEALCRFNGYSPANGGACAVSQHFRNEPLSLEEVSVTYMIVNRCLTNANLLEKLCHCKYNIQRGDVIHVSA